MPPTARGLYGEAAAVMSGSRRAAAALARAALEAVLKETDTTGVRKNLQTRVGELQGQIAEPLWQVLTALRIVGNDSLHDGDDGLIAVYMNDEDGAVADSFFGAINALVETLITQPAKARELYAQLSPEKRAAAERAGRATPV